MPRSTPYEVEFVTESDALAGIVGISYDERHGHLGAFLAAQRSARQGRGLTLEDLCNWQRAIAEEQQVHGYPLAPQGAGSLRSPELAGDVAALLAELNANIATYAFRQTPMSAVAAVIGDTHSRVSVVAPFRFANGRVCRLLANYIASACRIPILVFRSTDEHALAEAGQRLDMRVLVARKIREAVFDRYGQLMRRVAEYGLSDRYRGPEGDTQLVVEWHELVEAVDAWHQGERAQPYSLVPTSW